MLPSTARAKSYHGRGQISSIFAHKLDVRECAKIQRRVVMESEICRCGSEAYRRRSFSSIPAHKLNA
jgi:hypothetical protein